MKTRYKLLVIFLSIFILNLTFPIGINCQLIGNQKLTVDNFTATKEEWQRIGADYQIDSNDNDTSYVRFNYTLENTVKTLSSFTFEDIPESSKPQVFLSAINVTSILNVTLYAWIRSETPGENFRVKFYWFNGSTYVQDGGFATSVSTWFLWDFDISSTLDTPEKVKDVRLYLTNYGAPSYDDKGRISYVYLRVWFTYEAYHVYPLRLILGLIGLAIMVISPTIAVKEVLKKQNMEMIGGCIVLFVIGYGLVLVWLTT